MNHTTISKTNILQRSDNSPHCQRYIPEWNNRTCV